MGLTEIRAKLKKMNQEYNRIEKILIPFGFTLCSREVFYGKSPFNIYIGKMKDYQDFIDNIDQIKERFLKEKNESLGFVSN